MINVLLHVTSGSRFSTLFEVAKVLKKTQRYSPIFFFARRYPVSEYERDKEKCNSEKIATIGSPRNKGGNGHWLDAFRKYLDASRIGFYHYYRFWKTKSALKVAAKKYQKDLLIDLNIALIILAQQTVDAPWNLGKRLGIPTVVVPFAFTTPAFTAKALSDHSELWVEMHFVNRRAAKQFPQWVMTHEKRRLLRSPGSEVLAMEHLNLAPANPWIQNAGVIDVLAVESERMAEFYLAQGIAKEKIALVGSPSDDILSEGLRKEKHIKAELIKKYQLDKIKPTILCSLPPDQHQLETEYSSYEEMITYWVRTLVNVPGWQVIFKLHPKMEARKFEFLQKKFYAKFASEHTAELIASSDLYVVPPTSATLRWAAAAGKPSLGYDPYDLGQIALPEIPAGCLIVHNRNDFHDSLMRLTQDAKYYDSLLHAQQNEMGLWGFLDGKVSTRLINLCDRLVNESRWKN